ncbi:MAG: CcmD family protein [Dehalococcoidia bacterium]|nr:CcmD family protein [Dehalococcoidia bacterium]
MDHIEYLFAGFAVFWGGLFIYLLLLQMRIRALSQEIGRLEERLAEAEAPPAARTVTPPAPPGTGGRGGRDAPEQASEVAAQDA